MFWQRVIVALVLTPLGLAAVMAGGPWVLLLTLIIICLTAWEYAKLFVAHGQQPAIWLVVGGSAALVLARYLSGHEFDAFLLPGLVLLAMLVHLIAFEAGRDEAATDFAVTLSGIFYVGLLGSHLVLMRALPDGAWWLMLTLPGVWLADTAAYFVGTRFGRRRLAPRLSPKKSWEGYAAGVFFATLGTPLLLVLFRNWGLPVSPEFSIQNAALLGLSLALLPTLGDLGESMIKRQAGVKDSGSVLPGHGGMFDRADSWLWALTIGYFLIVTVFTR